MYVLVLLSFLSIFILFIILRKTRARTNLPPGPPCLPLIGNLHQLDASCPHIFLWKLSKHYGPLMSLRLGSIPTLVVSSAKMAKEVLKTHDLKFATRPPFVGIKKFSYNGLDLAFAPYGPYWREMRKFCVLNFFSSTRVQYFRPIREDEVAQMIHKISQHEASNKAVNLNQITMSFANSLICRIAFGKKYGYDYIEDHELGSGKESRLQELLNEAEALFTEFYFSDHFPLMGWVDTLRGKLGKLDKIYKELDMIYERVIQDHMDPSRNKEVDDRKVENIIDIFLRLINDQSSSIDLYVDNIKGLLMNIFIAGTDTNSATITWAMTALLRNPLVMNKLQGEIRNLYGDKDFINEDDIQRLPYLKAVVKESLRMFPPAPLLLPREAIEKCNIEGYEIQPKTLVYVNAYAIARDPECWDKPEEFYPERFIGNSIDVKGIDFELIPFGAGRRICPALNMGLVTLELSLANLLHSFNWEVPSGINKEDMLDIQTKPGITMHRKSDLYLMVKKYTKEQK